MSENLCYADAYLRQTDATVVEIDPDAHAVLLDRTVFYPWVRPAGGRGVANGDSGGRWRVIGARQRSEDIWHKKAPARIRRAGAQARQVDGQCLRSK